MAKILKCLRSFIQKIDFFPATQFFRYKGESQYKTATGGFASIIIIIIILIFLSNSWLDMINKVNVTATSSSSYQIIPSPSNVTFGPNGDFMFAISILQFDFSDPTYTAFEVILRQEKYDDNGNSQITEVPLQACTQEHFQYGTDFETMFNDYGMSSYLCPPLNYQFQIQGKIISSFQQISIRVMKCDPTRHGNCLTDAEIINKQTTQEYFSFFMLVINTQLNPSQSQVYKRYYVQDRNLFRFTTSLGILAIPEVQHYQISSDSSVLPFFAPTVEDGLLVTDVFQSYAVPTAFDIYVQVNFRKSPKLSYYTRTFQKVDGFLSYVGGLIGTVMGLFLIINSYNELCYSISLGNKLFLYDKETKINSDQFNFICYIRYVGYKICSLFGCCQNGNPLKIYEACSQELQKQLDISYLIKRIIFLERALLVIFDEHELASLHLQDQITLDEAKQLREKFKIKRQLEKKFNPNSSEEKYIKQTEQDFAQKDQIEMVPKPRKYESEMSASSCQTIKSSSVGSLRAKIKTLLSQDQDGGLKHKKILSNANPFLMQKINQQRYRTINNNNIIQDKNSFEGMDSFIGDTYFKEMQQKQSIKHKQQMQHYPHRKEDNL